MDNLNPNNELIEFVINVKDGNRLSRRLGRTLKLAAGGAGVGRGIGRALAQEPFDPNAFDGDNDGFVQDGTIFMRPVVLRGQMNLSKPTPKTPIEKDDTTPTQVAKETRRQRGLASSTEPPAIDRPAKKPDPLDRDWRRQATEDELARVFVPLTTKEIDELNERITVPRESYKTEEDYQHALNLHQQAIKAYRLLPQMKINALESMYDYEFGTGAFNKDIENNYSLFTSRVNKLFGAQEDFGNLMSYVHHDIVAWQEEFFDTLLATPNTPQIIKDLILEAKRMQAANNGFLYHGLFSKRHIDPSDGLEKPVPDAIGMMEYILARLIVGGQSISFMNMQEIMAPNKSPALDLVQSILELYFNFASQKASYPRDPMSVALREVARQWHFVQNAQDSTIGPPRLIRVQNVITNDQIKNRLDFAQQSGSLFGFIGTIFPNRIEMNDFFMNGIANAVPSEVRQDRVMLRAFVRRTLKENPEFLHAVREYGLPVIVLPHRVFSFVGQDKDLTLEMLTASPQHMSKSLLAKRIEIGKKLLRKHERLLRVEWSRRAMRGKHFTEPLNRGRTQVFSDYENGASGHFPMNAPLGGYFQPHTNEMVLQYGQLLLYMLNPSEASREIFNIENSNAISETIGEAAVVIHEYGHYLDYMLRRNYALLAWEQFKRDPKNWGISNIFFKPPVGTTYPGGVPHYKRFRDALVRREDLGFGRRHNGYDVVNGQRRMLKNRRTQPMFADPALWGNYPNFDNIPTGQRLFDVDNMTDSELQAAITELEGQLQEMHATDTLSQRRRNEPNRRRHKDISKDSINSSEPYVVTPYGQTDTTERFAEIFASVTTRLGQKHPFLVNNAAVKLVARILGLNTEPQTVTSMWRRRKTSRGTFSDEVDDISDRILSNIKIVAPQLERTADGHRPGFNSSTSDDNLRFDPNERSRLTLRTNLNIDTDERLYANPTPTLLTDYGSRARLLHIGDHHFYDNRVPFASFLDQRTRQSFGESAGQRYINRNRPHHGDMVRAISSIQFGLFVDDMPIYDTTTEGNKDMLRSLVTGKIAKLPISKRSPIEAALKDAADIHLAVQASEPNKRELFRIINIDRETFLEGFNIGDSIPMPITAVSSTMPHKDNTVIIRVEKGAKAIDVGNGQFLTQGNFEVTKIQDNGTNVIVTLSHKEVFDPRHDAMRPVDKSSDVPKKMRKMGASLARYTPEEQEKMNIEMQKRKDHTDVLQNRGLASSTTEITPPEMKDFLDYERVATNREEYQQRMAPFIERARKIVSDHIQTSVQRRLTQSIKAIKNKYGRTTPWKDDVDSIRKWRTLDTETTRRAIDTLRDLLIKNSRIGDDKEEISFDEYSPLYKFSYLLSRIGFDGTMSRADLERLLATGEFGKRQTGHYLTDEEIREGFISIPEIINPQTEATKELRQVLQTTLDALKSVQRAYLLDGSSKSGKGGVIAIDDTAIEVEPLKSTIGSKGAYVVLQGYESGQRLWNYSNNSPISFKIQASFTTSGQKHRSDQYFEREIYLNEQGNIKIKHSNFMIREAGEGATGKGRGIGTLLQQHAALWWRQHAGTEIFIPSAVLDGVIVWPRMNYQYNLADNDTGGFKEFRHKLIVEIRNILRAALFEDPNIDEDEEGISAAPSIAADIDYGLKTNNDFRQRLIGWLALARMHESTNNNDTGLITILANIIEPRELTGEQKFAWKQLFDDSNLNLSNLSIIVDRQDNDWLPAFAIPDQPDDPELSNFGPTHENRQRAELIGSLSDNKMEEFDLFIGPLDSPEGLNQQQAGRLAAIIRAGDHEEVNLFKHAEREKYARESAAFNSPPRLITRTELEERINAGEKVLYGISNNGDNWSNDEVPVALEGVKKHLTKVTSEPFRYLDKMVDKQRPDQDPAQNKNGLIILLDPKARVLTNNQVEQIVLKLFPNINFPLGAWIDGNYDSLINDMIKTYGVEVDTGTLKLIVPKTSITTGSASDIQLHAFRLAKAFFAIENQRRLQNNPPSLVKLRNDLLAEFINSTTVLRTTLIPILLGTDAIKHGNRTYEILNNRVIQILDEKVSFAQAAQMIDDPNFRVIPHQKSFTQETEEILERINGQLSIGQRETWYLGDDARLLPDDAIEMPPRAMQSFSYINQVRQDFNVDLNRDRGFSSGQFAPRTTENRLKARKAGQSWLDFMAATPEMFQSHIDALKKDFDALLRAQEKWDAIDLAKGPDEPVDVVGRRQIQEELNLLADKVVHLINSSNNALEEAIDHEATRQAIEILREQKTWQTVIPPRYIERLERLADELEQETRLHNINLKRLYQRQTSIRELLSDFHIAYEVRKTLEGEESIELANFIDSDVKIRVEDISLLIFNMMFSDKKRPIDAMRMEMDAIRTEINALQNAFFGGTADPKNVRVRLDEIFRDVPPGERAKWREKLDLKLDNDPLDVLGINADYLDYQIESTPTTFSTAPREVPTPTWRKVRAAMSRSRSTKYEGERIAAEEAAMRLLEKYRPDLANEKFVRGIRSSTITQPTDVMRPNFSQKTTMRGLDPESPLVNLENQFGARLIDRMRSLGYDIEIADLMPTGKYGRMFKLVDKFENLEGRDFDFSDPLLAALVQQATALARENMAIIKIEGHSVKKILAPLDTEVADILGDELDVAMLRVMGSPTYEKIVNIAAAFYTERARLNRAFGTPVDNFTDQYPGAGAFHHVLRKPGAIEGGGGDKRDIGVKPITFTLGDDKTVVATIGVIDPQRLKEIEARFPSRYGEPISLLTLLSRMESSDARTNDVIFGVMNEIIGSDYESKDLKTLRDEYAAVQEIVGSMTFAPSPAGRHVKQLFEQSVEKFRILNDLTERLGQRYVHLLRSRGITDSEIKDMFALLRQQNPGGPFRNGTYNNPGLHGSVIQTALEGFLMKNMRSLNLPQITDSTIEELGLHETGHSFLGQGFTRHGEFTANFWAFALYGPAFWPVFAQMQAGQERFDRFTIQEKFGHKLTPEQILNVAFVKVAIGGDRRYLGLTISDRQQIKDSVFERIDNDPNLNDAEKTQIKKEINEHFFIKFDEYEVTDETRRLAEEAGVDPEALQFAFHATSEAVIRTNELLDPTIPLPARVFGWIRENGMPDDKPSGLSPEIQAVNRRQEFQYLANVLLELLGRGPAFIGDETPEQMALAEKEAKEKKNRAKKKFAKMIETVNQLAKKYPELGKEFADELGKLK